MHPNRDWIDARLSAIDASLAAVLAIVKGRTTMDPALLATLQDMQTNVNAIGARIQNLIDQATLKAMGQPPTPAAELNAALKPVATALRMLANPSSSTSSI